MTTVLVVDDEPDIRELIIWKLTQAGFSTCAASDGEHALAVATGASGGPRPDLILLDWMMPRMSGIEVCVALRENAATAGIPVILLTARAQASEVEGGFAAGADDYIVKPFSPRDLLNRVESVLARSKERP